MKKVKRQKEIKLRRNFFLTLIVTVFLWLFTFSLIYFTEPDSFAILLLFFLLVFFSLLFSFSVIFANTRRGIILATIITVFLILRYFGIGNILNFLLLAGIGIAVELYFLKK